MKSIIKICSKCNLEKNYPEEFKRGGKNHHKKCKLSGEHIYFSKSYKEKGNASLDRKDNTKGYIKGNVQWLHKHINMMKSTHNEQYFISLCQQISNNGDNNNEFCG